MVVEPDEWQVDRVAGTVTVTHKQPRVNLFTPGLLGDNFPGWPTVMNVSQELTQ